MKNRLELNIFERPTCFLSFYLWFPGCTEDLSAASALLAAKTSECYIVVLLFINHLLCKLSLELPFDTNPRRMSFYRIYPCNTPLKTAPPHP